MTRTSPPIAWVTAGSWKDGTATFACGHPVRDEALVRLNQAAVLLREHREGAHLSGHMVARWAGLRRDTISDLENGQSWADAVTVHRVAVVLGLDSNLRPDPQGRMGPRASATTEADTRPGTLPGVAAQLPTATPPAHRGPA